MVGFGRALVAMGFRWKIHILDTYISDIYFDSIKTTTTVTMKEIMAMSCL